MNKRLLVLVVLAALALPSGCASAQGKIKTEYAVAANPITPFGLEQAGLAAVWQYDLAEGQGPVVGKWWHVWEWRWVEVPSGRTVSGPYYETRSGEMRKRGEMGITGIYLYDKTVLVATSDNVVTAFERESGAILWLTQLAEPLKVAPTLFDGTYYAVCGQRLVTMDAKGEVAYGNRFSFSIPKPLVVIENYIYAVGSDGALHKVDKDTLTDVWTSAAQTYSVIADTPILVETMLVFGTEDGHVLGIDRVVGGRRLDISGVGPVVGSVVSDGQMLYFGTANYYLYCYSRLGDLVWRAAAEGIMQEPPVMAGDRLYATVVSGGLIALDRKDGSITWRNNGVQEYVSTNGSQVFATSAPRDMLAVDTGAGEIQTIIDTKSLVRAMNEMKRMGRQRLVFFVGKDGLISWDTAGGEELAYGRDERVAGVPGEKQEVISFESNIGPVQIPVNKAFAEKVASLPKDQLIFAVGNDGSILVLWKETETQENASRRPRVFSTSGQRELWILDAVNGRIQARVDASMYDLAPRNLAGDGLVFLASKDGRIICLRAK